GEALVSFLEGNGTPSMVERCMVRPPSARLGPITPDERKALMAKSSVKGKYDQAIDSESAYELLQKRLQSGAAGGPIVATPGAGRGGASAAFRPRRGTERYRQRAGRHLRYHSSAPNAAFDRSGDRAGSDAFGQQPRGGPNRGRHRQINRRRDGQLGRTRHRAWHHGRHFAAVAAAGGSSAQGGPPPTPERGARDSFCGNSHPPAPCTGNRPGGRVTPRAHT